MKKWLSILLAIAPLTSCTNPKIIVVRGEVDPKRTFSVIPSGYLDYEIEYAGSIEQELVRAGLQLLERPPIKFMVSDSAITNSSSFGAASTNGKTAIGASVGSSITQPGKIVDVVSMYPDSKATHIVVTYAAAQRVRIIEKASGAVIANIDLHSCSNKPAPPNSNLEDRSCETALLSSLAYANLISFNIDEKQCAFVNRKAKTR